MAQDADFATSAGGDEAPESTSGGEPGLREKLGKVLTWGEDLWPIGRTRSPLPDGVCTSAFAEWLRAGTPNESTWPWPPECVLCGPYLAKAWRGFSDLCPDLPTEFVLSGLIRREPDVPDLVTDLKKFIRRFKKCQFQQAVNPLGYFELAEEWYDLSDRLGTLHVKLTSSRHIETGQTTPPAQQPSLTPSNRSERGEGGKLGQNQSKGVPLVEANILIREWLENNAAANPGGITRDAVAKGTGVSTGQVSNTAAWKAFRDRRDAQAKPTLRKVQLTDRMRAVIPTAGDKPEELAALIEESKRDERAEESRPLKRGQRPS